MWCWQQCGHNLLPYSSFLRLPLHLCSHSFLDGEVCRYNTCSVPSPSAPGMHIALATMIVERVLHCYSTVHCYDCTYLRSNKYTTLDSIGEQANNGISYHKQTQSHNMAHGWHADIQCLFKWMSPSSVKVSSQPTRAWCQRGYFCVRASCVFGISWFLIPIVF